MQYKFYKQILSKFELYDDCIKDENMEIKKPILLISHELTRTGAPTVLFDLGCMLKKDGYDVFLVAYSDGKLKDDILNNDMVAVICDKIDKKWLIQLADLFELCVVNTLVLTSVIDCMKSQKINIIWWIHESEAYFINQYSNYKNICPMPNLQIVAAGPYVFKMIQQYMGFSVPILNFGVKDLKEKSTKVYSKKVHFVHVGTMAGDKGQMVLASAIDKLPQLYMDRAKFTFIGALEYANRGILKRLIDLKDQYSNVEVLDAMNQKKLFDFYNQTDCIIVSSIVEPTSAVAVEGLMKEKICICSDVCGVTYYLKDGENALIFPSKNIDALTKKIEYVIDNIDNMYEMRKNGRKVYENVYSLNALHRNFNEIVNYFDEPINQRNMLDIIVYNYNSTQHMNSTLDSIQKSHYTNYEIIIVDDCSDEDVLPVLESRYADNDNVFYIRNEQHIGLYETFRLAHYEGKGDVFAFITAGTIVDSNHFNLLINDLDRDKNLTAVFSYANVYDRKSVYKSLPTKKYEGMEYFSKFDLGVLFDKCFWVEAGLFRKTAEIPDLYKQYGKSSFYQYMIMLCNTEHVRFNRFSTVDAINGLLSGEESTISDKEQILFDILIVVQYKNKLKSTNLFEKKLELLWEKAEYSDKVDYLISNLEKNSEEYNYYIDKYNQKECENEIIHNPLETVEEIEKCVGCRNCENICPVDAIDIIEEKIGILKPVVDTEKCIKCRKCIDVCPLNGGKTHQLSEKICYAVAADSGEREKSSSGAVFPLIADIILKDGGYVCGAVFDTKNNFSVKHIITNDRQKISDMRGSKYAKSDLGNCFEQIKKHLQNNKQILFTGTPCQVAALYKYIPENLTKNLIAMDFICHGTPSNKVYADYIASLEQNNKQIRSIQFRNKKILGWNTGLIVEYNDGTRMIENSSQNEYMRGYLTDYTENEGCYTCKFKETRMSDITIGDFWGIDKIYAIDSSEGISFFSYNTSKGKRIYDCIKDKLVLKLMTDYRHVIKANPSICKSIKKKKTVEDFRLKYEQEKSISKAINYAVGKYRYDIALVLMFSENYGNALTNYGLYKFLEKLGKKVCVLDNFGTLFPKGKFNTFAHKYYNCSSDYLADNDFANINTFSNMFIVGSDQTWNYQCEQIHGFGSYYHLDFVNNDIPKIAYAPSYGASDTYKEPDDDIVNLYKRFNAISVRESYGVDICKSQYGVNAVQVVDPVFLLEEGDYEKVASQSGLNISEKFITAYILNPSREKIEYIRNVARQKNIGKVVIILDAASEAELINRELAGYYDCYFQICVEEWLYYFMNGTYIITDSFHGVCFATIFKKQFIAFRNRQSDRFNLFSKYGNLQENIYSDVSKCPISLIDNVIDYKDVYVQLQKDRMASIDWLKNVIEF